MRKWGCHVCAYCIQMQILNYAKTLGSFLILFRSLSLDDHIIISIFHLVSSFCQLVHWIILIACFISWCFSTLSSFCNLLILNIVWFPPSIRQWIHAFDSTHIMRNAHILEELSLYWPLRVFTHFGNRCQWGRSLEGSRELVLCFLLCA